MKKFLFLGLILMLLAPLPVSAKNSLFVVINDLDNFPCDSYQNIISFEGGTYVGLGSSYDLNLYIGCNVDAVLEYEFEDNQNTTRLHADLSVDSIIVELPYPGYNDKLYKEGGVIPVYATSSEFISDEMEIPYVIFVDIYKKRTVNVEYLEEGLSVQLRENYVEYSLFDHDLSYDEWVPFDHYKVLGDKKGPLENGTLEGYGVNGVSMCISGFDWSKNKLLLTVVDGDTIRNLGKYREQRVEYSGRENRPQKTVTYDGVDIPLSKPITNLKAKIVDIPDDYAEYPFTYKLNSFYSASITSVDKNFAGALDIQPEVIGDYINERQISEIGDQAMLNRKNITSLSIPQYVSHIGINALSGMAALGQINVDSKNDFFKSVDGVLFNKDLTTLIQFPIAKAITQYNVPDETTTIGRDAFFQSKLTSISLPSTLTTIDYDAFGYSKQLKSISIPQSVTTLGEYAFDHCTGLTTVSLPNITALHKYAFNSCTSLTIINIPLSLQSIGDYAFYNCTALTKLELPQSLKAVGNNAFKGCKKITEVICKMTSPIPLPDNAFTDEVYNNAVLQVPKNAINLYKNADGWKNFKNIVADPLIVFDDDKVKEICVANWDTNGDAELSLNEAAAVTSLGSVFSGNNTIKSFNELQLFTGLTKIDDNAFKACKSLQSVILPPNVKQIGKSAFYTCYDLTNIVLPEGLEVINDYAIGACTKLTAIGLPTTLTTIKTRAFYYDKQLSSITLPASVTSIGNYAFASCPIISVRAYMMTPCNIPANVFTNDTYKNAALYVPYGTYALYKSTNYWSKFANIKTMTGQVSLTAEPISIVAGESGNMVLKLKQNPPTVSFQFDLYLVSGITLQDATIIPSSDLVVSVANRGYNHWKILAYSPTGTPFESNVGDLISLNIKVEELLAAGDRTVTISNIILTSPYENNLIRYSLKDINTTISVVDDVVTDAGKGDVNLDGAINVQDIVVLVNYITSDKSPKKFSAANADANDDGFVDVTDVSTIVLLCMPAASSNAAPAHAPAANVASMTWDTTNGLALSIDDATSYVAAQMDVTVNGTLQVNNITAADGHTPVWQQIGENRYRVLVFSSANDTFSAFGPHLFFDVQGEGEITLSNALLVDAAGDGFNAAASSTGVTTGITTITTELSAPADIYSVSGQLVRRQATSLKGLPAGIYLVNGRKMAVK